MAPKEYRSPGQASKISGRVCLRYVRRCGGLLLRCRENHQREGEDDPAGYQEPQTAVHAGESSTLSDVDVHLHTMTAQGPRMPWRWLSIGTMVKEL